jgi:hypothetical protein
MVLIISANNEFSAAARSGRLIRREGKLLLIGGDHLRFRFCEDIKARTPG